MVYKLITKTVLPVSLKEAWEFFSSPANLGKITPPEMNFRILNSTTGTKVAQGTHILYKVSPLLGIPLTWETEILACDKEKTFVDVQRKGPYRLWHHIHYFREVPGGVEMYDEVKYKLPMGILGRFMHFLFIRKKVEGIFEFRNSAILKIFPRKQS